MKKGYSCIAIGIICLFMVSIGSGQVGSYTEHFNASDLNKTHYSPDTDTSEILQQAATQRSNLVNNSTEKLLSQLKSEDVVNPEPQEITTPYVPGEVIIMYRPVSSMSSQRVASYAVSAVPEAELIQDFSAEGLTGLASVDLAEGISVEEALETYSNSPYVAYAEPNYIIQLYPPVTEPGNVSDEQNSSNATQSVADLLSSMNDPLFPNLWGLYNDGSTGGTPDADIDAPEAWVQTTGSSNVVVGVIDTGIDYTHPDLAANIWTNAGEIPNNNIDDDKNGYIDDVHGWDFVNNDNDPMDDQGHGTHCAGTIAAIGNNGIGVAGVAWKAKLMPLKFLDATGQGDTIGALNAINYARMMGADILSCSWGSGAESQAMYDTFQRVPGLIVCAAGNQGSDNDATGHYPSNFNLNQIISVAATTNTDNLAGFSNYGKTMVDVAAPGDHIASCAPNTRYVYLSGTSMATPHVSGLAVLLKSVQPGLSAQQIKQLIMQNVDPLSVLSGKTVSGGRINAKKAVQAATGGSSPAKTYNIITTAGLGGSVTPAGTNNIAEGADIVISITPQTGYATSSLIVDGQSVAVVSTYRFSAVSKDHTIHANFLPIQSSCTITSSTTGGGTISPSGSVSISYGGTQTFTMTPSSGYHISDVRVDATSVGTPETYTFSQVTSGHTITASFVQNYYTITSLAGSGGSINPTGLISLPGGSGQTYAISPNQGYQIQDVIVDGRSVGPVTQYQFNQITGSHTITASFTTTSSGSSIVPLPNQQLKPTDPDGNNLYEDLNGNGRKDFQDVVLYFTYLEWIAANEPVAVFDYSGNGRIDFSDVIILFQMIQ